MPTPRSNMVTALVTAMLGALMPSLKYMEAQAARESRPAKGARPRKGYAPHKACGAAAAKRASRKRRNIAKHNRSAHQ